MYFMVMSIRIINAHLDDMNNEKATSKSIFSIIHQILYTIISFSFVNIKIKSNFIHYMIEW